MPESQVSALATLLDFKCVAAGARAAIGPANNVLTLSQQAVNAAAAAIAANKCGAAEATAAAASAAATAAAAAISGNFKAATTAANAANANAKTAADPKTVGLPCGATKGQKPTKVGTTAAVASAKAAVDAARAAVPPSNN